MSNIEGYPPLLPYMYYEGKLIKRRNGMDRRDYHAWEREKREDLERRIEALERRVEVLTGQKALPNPNYPRPRPTS